MTAQTTSRATHPLIKHLKDLVDNEDRAALAHLRLALGKPPGATTEAHQHVQPFLRVDTSRQEEDAAYLVASLFALWHQGKDRPEMAGEDRPVNLGTSFRRLPEDRRSDSVERRFRALLNAHRDDLPVHLRHAISLLRPHPECALDWARLFRDIRSWDAGDRWVQRAWARAYWGGMTTPSGTPADGDQDGTTTSDANDTEEDD